MSSLLESQASFEASALGFLYRQFTKPKPLPAGTDLKGSCAVVTGSNVGLGLEACRQLLELELSQLVMGVRSQAKGDIAASQLRKDFPLASITVWIVDMESYDSVQVFALQCSTLPRVDIAILNAGLMKASFTMSTSGLHESTLQINYLSTALLAILLLPTLRRSKLDRPSKIPVLSIVGSDMIYQAKVETTGPVFQQSDTAEGYSQFSWYARSKLLLTFFLGKLAEHISPDEVLINMPNPGMTKDTAWFRGYGTILMKMWEIAQFFLARSLQVAATTYIDAVLHQGRESHGSFTSDWTIKP
jgi:NAD(P)-dependent dehydrogenase (short-subunit alcohol dehydrogenase family)